MKNMHLNVLFVVLSGLIVIHVWVNWRTIYRWLNLPRRAPDYIAHSGEYWFDEFVAYEWIKYIDAIGTGNYKKKEHFFVGGSGKLEYNNVSYRIMDMEEMDDHIQKAYQQHIQKKFEEIVLD